MFGKNNANEPKTESLQEILTQELIPAQAPSPTPVPKPADVIDTIIGEGTRIVGSIHCKTLLRVDGIVEGDVQSDEKIVVNDKGMIKGNVTADTFILGGELNGNARVTTKTELLSSGKLSGDIITKVMIMDENALFDGNCTMGRAADELGQNALPDLPDYLKDSVSSIPPDKQ